MKVYVIQHYDDNRDAWEYIATTDTLEKAQNFINLQFDYDAEDTFPRWKICEDILI